jgi:DNA polymerase elongation subunit (family B)
MISYFLRRSNWGPTGKRRSVWFSLSILTQLMHSNKGPPPPGAVIAAKKLAFDANDEAKYGDRIPYVIVRSATGARLVDRAMDPLRFMNNR